MSGIKIFLLAATVILTPIYCPASMNRDSVDDYAEKDSWANRNHDRTETVPVELLPSADMRLDISKFNTIQILPVEGGHLRVRVNSDRIAEENLVAYLRGEGRDIALKPVLRRLNTGVILELTEPTDEGYWTLDLPEGYLIFDTPELSREKMPEDETPYVSMEAHEGWSVKGKPLEHPGIFSVHDDDGLDVSSYSSWPSAWMTGGYFTTMFPMLESLGIKGNVAAEGQRMGFTNNPPVLSDNGNIMRKLQDEYGWDIMSHTMTARYYTRNWLVESLDSDLARRIMRGATYAGDTSNTTTSVYDLETKKEYRVNASKTEWVEVDSRYYKAYISDYDTGKVLMYSPLFSVDYQHGKWFELARQFGINARCWTSCGGIISHANVREINKICPWGFADLQQNGINTVPFGTTVTRMSVDGLYLPGYKGEQDTDNSFNREHFEYYKSKIDETAEKGGWIVLSMHAYRPAYYNYRPGALVSEGGTYPDEWVYPVRSLYAYPSTFLEPPTEIGINSWSDWYPCPGTRLEMIWELCKYAVEKGLIPVTSSEGFELMGNKVNEGLYTKGGNYDIDREGIIGTRKEYPHYVVGANGEAHYYHCEESPGISAGYQTVKPQLRSRIDSVYNNEDQLLNAVSPSGQVLKIRCVSGLQPGIWIVNGQKIIVK